MKIEVLEPYGYCTGVALAMKMAEQSRKDNKDANIVVLGMLVHNDDALKQLEN